MIRLDQLDRAPFAATRPVARRGGESLTWDRFRDETGGTARHLAGCRKVMLLCQDGWRFAVGLFGAWSAGAAVILPSHVRTGGAAQSDADVVLDDTFVPTPAAWERGSLSVRSALHLHTSGSTGEAKCVVRSLGQLNAEAAMLESLWGASLSGADTVATVPHHHAFGLMFRLLWPLGAGRPFCARRHDLWEDLLAELPERAVIVTSPAHLTRLGGMTPLNEARRPRLILSAGAPLPEAAADEARRILGRCVTEIYGSTETGAIAARHRDGGEPPWRPLPGRSVTRTGAGILRVDGPDGTVEIADRVRIDDDGGFHLQGRADRIAKIDGKRIGLDAVERALRERPEVSDAAVVVLDGAQPVLAAAVTLSADGRALLADRGGFRLGRALRTALAGHLDPAAAPRRWRFVEALPVGTMGKRPTHDLAALFAPPPRLPPLLERRDLGAGAVDLDLAIDPALIWFKGHFPGHPILPGVVQIDWAVRFARLHLGLDLPAAREFQIKFKATIGPGDRVTLTLRHVPARNRLDFQYRRGDVLCASGTAGCR